MFENSEIRQAVNSVYKTTQSRIMKQYGIDDVEEAEAIADKMLKIHGMDREHFSVIKQIEAIINGSLNDCSIDDNGNKSDKTIKGTLKESTNPIDKIVGYRFLYRKMAEIYGKKEAKYLTSCMYDYTIAISDSTNILIEYCWSFDASKLVTMGKPFGQLPSKPVKRLDSYISLLNEIIHQMSNHLAGAIAIGTFFLDIAHLLMVKENKTIDDLMEPKYRELIKNQFQRFIHGVNSLSRSGGAESPFTNVSLFDREKLTKLVGEEYAWYYCTGPELQPVADTETIIEFIIELQNIYMEFFDKGDPSNNGMPYRFPISTLNISKKKNKDEKWIVEDRKFLKSVCKKDIYRYNIFVSEGNKIASCCRLINDTEMADLASQANSFGAGGSISLGSHRVITINFVRAALMATSPEDFLARINKATYDCKKILYAHKQLMYDLKEMQLFVKLGWIQLDRMFSTIGLLGYVEAEEILRKKFKDKKIDFMGLMFDEVNEVLPKGNEQFPGCIWNVEQIPAESMCHRLVNADKLLFGADAIPYDIYSNQIVPLWDENLTIWEKMERNGKYLVRMSGGGIAWINTGEHITPKQAERLIDHAVECNLEHFAINGAFCKCEDGHVIIGDRDLCAKCGKPIKQKITRTVGYFVDTKDMTIPKYNYDFKRRKEHVNGDFDRSEN
jgi:ribonucleoside-triphosphate reductase (formate)